MNSSGLKAFIIAQTLATSVSVGEAANGKNNCDELVSYFRSESETVLCMQNAPMLRSEENFTIYLREKREATKKRDELKVKLIDQLGDLIALRIRIKFHKDKDYQGEEDEVFENIKKTGEAFSDLVTKYGCHREALEGMLFFNGVLEAQNGLKKVRQLYLTCEKVNPAVKSDFERMLSMLAGILGSPGFNVKEITGTNRALIKAYKNDIKNYISLKISSQESSPEEIYDWDVALDRLNTHYYEK